MGSATYEANTMTVELQIIEKHNNVSYVIISPVDADNNSIL